MPKNLEEIFEDIVDFLTKELINQDRAWMIPKELKSVDPKEICEFFSIDLSLGQNIDEEFWIRMSLLRNYIYCLRRSFMVRHMSPLDAFVLRFNYNNDINNILNAIVNHSGSALFSQKLKRNEE